MASKNPCSPCKVLAFPQLPKHAVQLWFVSILFSEELTSFKTLYSYSRC